MDSPRIVERFKVERQALAMMDHPNIAKILDMGTTEPLGAPASLPARSTNSPNTPARMPALPGPFATGRPYFVMELVRGIRITDYCDQNQLPTKERLNLFFKVAGSLPLRVSRTGGRGCGRCGWRPRDL